MKTSLHFLLRVIVTALVIGVRVGAICPCSSNSDCPGGRPCFSGTCDFSQCQVQNNDCIDGGGGGGVTIIPCCTKRDCGKCECIGAADLSTCQSGRGQGNCCRAASTGTAPDCFSATATVQVLGKGVVAMKDLQVGDQVSSGDAANSYQPVYAFAHLERTKTSQFLQLQTTSTGSARLDVQMQTSTEEYPEFANGMTLPISHHDFIHMVLAPLRMLCVGVSPNLCSAFNTEDGKPFWVDWGMKLASVAEEQRLPVQLLMVAVVLLLIVPIFVVEKIWGATYAPLFFSVGGIALAAFRRFKFDARSSYIPSSISISYLSQF